MKLKKLPRKITLILLTTGASLILGFLSFGGMFALWPILPLAFTAFALSVVYEGEIYLQNITGAWNKLFKFKHLERQLAKSYLLAHFPKDVEDTACPEFFRDYDKQLQLVHAFGHVRLDKESKAQKKREEKTLADMEKRFALMLFKKGDEEQSTWVQSLRGWLNEKPALLRDATSKLNQYSKAFWWMKHFSILASIFMSLGTTYLLVEAFSAIPFFASIAFASWPLFIVPMALIAGAAYGLLTYNAITDMYNSDTLNNWLKEFNIREKGLTVRTGIAFSLVALALMLTVCTAGTWWTVVKETRPLLSWISRLPGFIMGLINPIITGMSAVIFNLENTHQSLTLIMSYFNKASKTVHHIATTLHEKESLIQFMNPFRFILTLTILPLRILLFAGHLISIGVTADRLPGVPTLFSALMGIISECFEDIHYFFGHEHACGHHGQEAPTSQALREARLKPGEGHHHDLDIPTWLIEGLLTPVYYLAAVWDYYSSSKNIHFSDSQKKMGFKKEVHLIPHRSEAEEPSLGWALAHAIQRAQRHQEKEGHDPVLASLQTTLCNTTELKNKEELKEKIETVRKTINPNQFFATQAFLGQELPDRLHLTDPIPAIGLNHPCGCHHG